MRLEEFSTSIRDLGEPLGLELSAWSKYRRGDVPKPGELAYIDRRVKAKYPTAEFVSARRRFVPVDGAKGEKPEYVTWELTWRVMPDTFEF